MIDPEVALKACQEVLLKVKLLDNKQQQDNQKQHHQHAEATDCGGPPWHMNPDTSFIKEEEEENDDEGQRETPAVQKKTPPAAPSESPTPSSSKQSWLLRLFESKLFDVSMAISYLYKSKEPGVQAYIGNRLFSFPDGEVDFYLPQLLNMYVHMDTEVGDAIKPYLVSPHTHTHTPGDAALCHDTIIWNNVKNVASKCNKTSLKLHYVITQYVIKSLSVFYTHL